MTENTIAVLPFVNMSSDPENEYFSDGITEEIINALARVESLKVTSRTSSFFFKGKAVPLKEIARQLDVAVVLEGSVRLAGNMVRISAQLIQTEDDFHFWSETWDRKLENIFEIQDEISLLIAEKLREQFGHFEIDDHLVNRPTDNLDAYAYWLKGIWHFNKWNPTDVTQAIEYFEKGIALDPNHTESYLGLADAYGFMATTEFMPREATWEKVAKMTEKAYQLDSENAGVHYQLANLAFFTALDFQEAYRHAQKAIELQPNYPEAQQFIAFLYMLAGSMDAAVRHLDLALKIDPLSQETLFYQAYYRYRSGQTELALQQLDDILAINPKNIPAYMVRCYCLLQLGRFEEVIAFLDSMPEDIVVPDERLGIQCLTYILWGKGSEAQQFLDRLKVRAEDPSAFQAHSYLFLALTARGEVDEAFTWLAKALEMKSAILQLSYTDPLAAKLKADPRYEQYRRQLYGISVEVEEKVEKKRPPLLEAEAAAALQDRLLHYMEEETPYLNPNLSLRALADQLQLHPNQLSWLLNEGIGKNFNEFINHYRVEAFKRLALDPANAHISLIGLAYESGFNSKTVFNTYFKKEVGVTPGAFLKQQQS
jgi:adenylate cyclase